MRLVHGGMRSHGINSPHFLSLATVLLVAFPRKMGKTPRHETLFPSTQPSLTPSPLFVPSKLEGSQPLKLCYSWSLSKYNLVHMASSTTVQMVQFNPHFSSLQLKNISHEFLTDLGLSIYHIGSQFFRATCILQMNISNEIFHLIYILMKIHL